MSQKTITLDSKSIAALERCDKYYSQIATLTDQHAELSARYNAGDYGLHDDLNFQANDEGLAVARMHYEAALEMLHIAICNQRNLVPQSHQDERPGTGE